MKMLFTRGISLLAAILPLVGAVAIKERKHGARTADAVTGFVKTSGQNFELNGEIFTVVGANSYWVGLTGLNTSEMYQTFSNIAAVGATAVRTWGFNDVTSPSGDYYQLWTNGVATINYGATGLENFDNVVANAKANGIRLIVTLTNNWDNYGGMDVYVSQLTGTDYHDYFYTNPTVIAAYKTYLDAFVGRYVDEPGILAWELANEPRCAGTTGTTSGNCTTTTITNWISEISAYIHSIDPNHLVGIGDEGFYAIPTSTDYPYQGGEGINFTANLAVPTVDFGTAHLYPLQWGETADPIEWGVQWIQNHAASQKAQNKPVLVEEFGVTVNMTETYEAWYSAAISSGLTGNLIWQAGSYLASGPTPNDGYTIYPNNTVYQMEAYYAGQLKARNAA